jgi:hypothetical protein
MKDMFSRLRMLAISRGVRNLNVPLLYEIR